MADAIRLVSIYRGYDPRKFNLLLLGGAGPVHGGALALELSIPNAIIPKMPGTLSAYGLLISNVEHDNEKTCGVRTDKIDTIDLEKQYQEIEDVGLSQMKKDLVPLESVVLSRSADMRYVGQSYELGVPLQDGEISSEIIDKSVEDFHQTHERIYGHCDREGKIELVTLRTLHSYSPPKPKLEEIDEKNIGIPEELKGVRDAYFGPDNGYIEVNVYERYKLGKGLIVDGPCIIEQPDSTIVIYPGQNFYVDKANNIVIANKGV